MKKIFCGVIAVWILTCTALLAEAEVSIGIGLPNVSIGINLPLYPDLVRVPGYPVYYAPRMDANYFFYDGLYWVYQDDNWYSSSWYNGPWWSVEPEFVPLFILRIPVRYYRQPPGYFRGWQSNAPPRWGQHWGHDWEQRRSGWDRWKRGSAPAPAPLPVYQRNYSGDRYPHVEQQQKLRSQQYRYQPRDKVVRQQLQQQGGQNTSAPAQRGKQEEPRMRDPKQQLQQRATPQHQERVTDPRTYPMMRGGEDVHKSPPATTPQQQRAPAVHDQRQQQQREQQAPQPQRQEEKGRDRGESKEPHRGQVQGQNNDDERGRGHDK